MQLCTQHCILDKQNCVLINLFFLQRYSLVLLVVLYIIYKLSAVNFLNILRQKQISIRVFYFALQRPIPTLRIRIFDQQLEV